MYSTRSLSVISSIILVIFLIVSIYSGILSPPPLITYTTDENFIGESGIFLLYGNTPRALEWAALPSIFIAYLLFLIWCGIVILKSISSIHGLPDVLTIIDKNAFYYLNHREEFVIWERWIQIFIVGLIVYKTIQFIIHSKHPILKSEIRIILTLLCLCADVIWITVPVIRPEALSGSLFLYIIVRILFTEKITLQIAPTLLILFILTFTQRLIFVFFSPFVIGSILFHLWEQKIAWKTYLKYFLIIILALFALMPFIITDTMVVMKSFLGGVFIKINHNQMDSYFNMDFINNFLSQPINIFFSIFAIIGSWFLVKLYSSKFISILFIANFLFILFSSLKAAQLYITHTFPLSMMAIIMVGFGINSITQLVEENQKKWVLGILALFLITNSFWAIHKSDIAIIQQQQNIADAVSWIKGLENNEKIALTLDFDGLILKNKACLFREYEANASDNYRIRKLSKLLKLPTSDSVSKFSLPILAQSFAFEDEKLFDTQYQISLKYVDSDSTKRFDTEYFFENNNNMSHCILQEQALKRFQTGNYKYIISKDQILNLTPVKSFTRGNGIMFWAYEFKSVTDKI